MATTEADGYKKMAERNRAWAARAESVAKSLQEAIDGLERRRVAELAAKDRELDWLRVENLHFLEKIGRLLRVRDDAYDELTQIGPGMPTTWAERAHRATVVLLGEGRD